MANYVSKMRTSHFRVKDNEAFLKELQKYSFEDLSHHEAEDGTLMLMGEDFWTMFKNEDSMEIGPDGLYLPGEEDQFEIAPILQEHILDDEIILINMIGSEKMRFLIGESGILTKKDVIFISSEKAVKQLAVAKGLITEEQSNKLDCTY